MTKESHQNGTERCAEIVEECNDTSLIINIQGDEPFIHPEMINQLCSILDGNTELGTLVKKIEDPAILSNHNVMKVVLNKKNEAMYFSRNCIPYVRGHEIENWISNHDFFKHIGIYAYRSDVLQEIAKLSPSKLELAESLEQLRWLEEGFKIKVAKTLYESHGVDTPEDLIKINKSEPSE